MNRKRIMDNQIFNNEVVRLFAYEVKEPIDGNELYVYIDHDDKTKPINATFTFRFEGVAMITIEYLGHLSNGKWIADEWIQTYMNNAKSMWNRAGFDLMGSLSDIQTRIALHFRELVGEYVNRVFVPMVDRK